MPTPYAPAPISPGNDFDVYTYVVKRSTTAPRVRVPATGLTVTAYLVTAPGANAIAGTTIALPEVAEGEYLGTINGSALVTALAPYSSGTSLWVVIEIGTSAKRYEQVVVTAYPEPNAP